MQTKSLWLILYVTLMASVFPLPSQSVYGENSIEEIKQDLLFCSNGKVYRLHIVLSDFNSILTDSTPLNYIVEEISALSNGMYVCSGTFKQSGGNSHGKESFFLYASLSGNQNCTFFSDMAFNDIALSPDGEKVAYTILTPGKERYSRLLYCRHLKTNALYQLTSNGFTFAPSWSSDGEKIVFYYAYDSNYIIRGGISLRITSWNEIKNIEIAPPSEMTRYNELRDQPPIWTKDGLTIFFEAIYDRNLICPQIYKGSSEKVVGKNRS